MVAILEVQNTEQLCWVSMKVPKNSATIFCSITHGLYEPWLDILHSGQTPTWLSNENLPGFSIHHYHGIPGNKLVIAFDKLHERIRWTNRWVATPLNIWDEVLGFPFRSFIPSQTVSSRVKLKHSVNQINLIDIYATMKWKDLAIFDDFIKTSSADFLFMTTTSSYVRPKKLLEVVSHFPKMGIYAGAVAYPGANFAAGNNRLFSRDVIIQILKARRELSAGTIEDLALGRLCDKLGFRLIELPKINIGALEELDKLSDQQLSENFHFRLKSGTFNDRNDVMIMQELHRRVKVLDGI